MSPAGAGPHGAVLFLPRDARSSSPQPRQGRAGGRDTFRTSGEKAAAPRALESLGQRGLVLQTGAGIVPAPGFLGKPRLAAPPGTPVGPPCPYVISWALSWGFLRSSSDSRQCRKLSRVTSGLGLTVILSLWFHTSRPIRATRRRRGWYS
uniref:Uncharacterized protein n=1 Tax=Serinus canaria TaxID=9135 RepID=A0A8C9MLS2_SERCA